ncbi:Glycosyl transferase group 1 [Fulvimarina pelagi HTCC2506]|uniref:sucrose-phosphate synthase n=1 Tax=Fulvimarina pelagi HTCC2506 TaxID=314231 RepID=Q0G2P1_9HYPH|nr:HAD-IIB family hydrolase [Fulvimarina pelagi]EAU42140.1 Glycosyl transferase group 1 [Fulvimarina pelagi HTCC2506]
MFIVHVALQGCLKSKDVDYGITSDTGGHIKYLLELVAAQAKNPAIARIVIATRAFDSVYGDEYRAGIERIGPKVEIVRIATARSGYLAKEDIWSETESFAAGLGDWLETQEAFPDLLHAHYADAATVAATVRSRYGTPFVFTAHSLGRIKKAVVRLADLPSQARASLERRIEIEEKAFDEADLIIASSRDEAEVQYAAYRNYDPGKIRIIEPGIDLAVYRSAEPTQRVDEMIAPFLRYPDKPVILAIARPVAKKNLPLLVESFGRDPWLRENANLLIIAGTREDINGLDPELAEEMHKILDLIDRYDLYGKVAVPKSHRPSDVPAIYAFARARGGIFANPALNEPFGLTLLEATASGLPVVATDSGGPNDIVERCGNGRLINPQEPDQIAEACRDILRDEGLRKRYAEAGSAAVSAYDWQSHAERCRKLVARLTLTPRSRRRRAMRQLLVCDIDNTLTGSPPCIRAFRRWHEGERSLTFAVATGRSFHSALSILEKQDAPNPEIIISSVGSEIYWLEPNGVTYRRDEAWSRFIAKGWKRSALRDALDTFEGIIPQGALEQREFKLSYLAEGDGSIITRLHAHLRARGLSASIIHSHGRYLDVLPPAASKGAAIVHLNRRLKLAVENVFAAGDSGNDIEMLRSVPQSIIVANYSDSLAARPDLAHSYVARKTHALGIIEGVKHFRSLATRARTH